MAAPQTPQDGTRAPRIVELKASSFEFLRGQREVIASLERKRSLALLNNEEDELDAIEKQLATLRRAAS
jgi:hypothetical protein